MKRVTNGFAKLSLPEFSQTLTIIISSMTGNPHFTSLQTDVQAMTAEADIYFALAVKAAKRDKDVILARDASRARVIDLLHDLGMQVTAVAKSNAEILSSSGFPYSRHPQNSPAMVKPETPRVSLGVNNGEIECKTSTQSGMKSVNYYITSDSTLLASDSINAWNVTSYNKTKFTFNNLVPGQRYYIKVGLVGVRGQEVISDAASYIAQ